MTEYVFFGHSSRKSFGKHVNIVLEHFDPHLDKWGFQKIIYD